VAQIKIRIGAERDRSVDATFHSIERRAARTAVLIGKMLNKGFADGFKGGNGRMPGVGGASGGAARARISAEEKDRITSAKREDNERVRLLKHRHRLERQEQNFTHKEGMRQLRQQDAQRLAGIRRQQREAVQAARTAERTRRQFAERTSHRATRFLMPNAPLGSMATRALGDFARGAGVDFSIAGSMSRVVGLEQQAQKVANSGYLAGEKDANGNPTANATRVGASELVAQARSVAGEYGLEASTALDALDGFATIAGDLALGRRLLGDMAKLSAATGTELGDMAAAAANVANQLDGVENKEEVINRVMKTIAGQGKLGAVEVADLSTHMARVAAASSKFAGDRAVNIQKMGALAQLARSKGGAPSAAEAARSVANLSTMFTKTARIDAFEKASGGGVKVYTDATKTKVRDPLAIIEDSLMATGGNLQKLNKMYQDTVAFRAVAGAASIFNDAGGGEAGRAKVRAELSRLLEGADLKDDEIDESSRRQKETAAAKAAQFQNQLDTIVEKVAKDLIPALDKAAPHILKFAELLGNIATSAINHPLIAGAGALGFVTMRAGIESAFRAGIEKMILGSRWGRGKEKEIVPPGTGTVPTAAGGGGAPGGAMGLVIRGLLIKEAAETGWAIGKALVDATYDGVEAGQNAAVQDTLAIEQQIAAWQKAGLGEDEYSKVRDKMVDLGQRKASAEVRQGNEGSTLGIMGQIVTDGWNRLVGNKTGEDIAREQIDVANLAQMTKDMAAMKELLGRPLVVRVNNLGDIPAGGAPPANAPQGIVPPPLPGG
jgi:hypothetical protein